MCCSICVASCTSLSSATRCVVIMWKMVMLQASAAALAHLFAPNLIHPHDESMAAMRKNAQSVSFALQMMVCVFLSLITFTTM